MPRDAAPGPAARRGPRSAGLQAALAVCALLVFCGFVALGIWQVERLAWKHALVERVAQRVQAPAQDAPGPDRWPQINKDDDEYRHVRLTGRLLHGQSTRVQATTALGAGFWLMTPLLRPDGSTVLANRGFVPPDWRTRGDGDAGKAAPDGPVALTGLLRMTEPSGGFLRRNDPAADRWHSRDVQAIASARGLSRVAPYFVDAAAPQAGTPAGADRSWPAAGLTVVAFADHHLVYALTWWALAAMVAGAAAYVVRDARRTAADAADTAGGAPGRAASPTAERPDAPSRS